MKADLSKPLDVDWARLAAYIDGEGTIRITRVNGRKDKREIFYLEVSVHNANPKLSVWLLDRFGGSVCIENRRDNPKWSKCIRWYSACKQASLLLEKCLPYFILKLDQAETALAFQATLKRWGVKGRPVAIYEQQRQYRRKLEVLKGTASRSKSNEVINETIQ